MSNLIFISQIKTDDLNLPQVQADDTSLANALKYIFAIIGALSVLMIAIAGIRYATSGGNPQNAASARSAIIYSLVGLVISVSAFVIVNFVFKAI